MRVNRAVQKIAYVKNQSSMQLGSLKSSRLGSAQGSYDSRQQHAFSVLSGNQGLEKQIIPIGSRRFAVGSDSEEHKDEKVVMVGNHRIEQRPNNEVAPPKLLVDSRSNSV